VGVDLTDPDVSDVDLVAHSAVDAEAFGVLYDRYSDRIHRYVLSRVKDRPTAEDVTADVFFKALRGLDSYRPDAGPFGAWLYRIATNTVIDHLRARRPTVSLDAEVEVSPDLRDPGALVEDRAIDAVEVEQVWKAVDELSDAQRTAVVLRLEGDLPIAEIAGRMNRSEGAVKLLLHRGLLAVRERLDDVGAGRSGRGGRSHRSGRAGEVTGQGGPVGPQGSGRTIRRHR
jgi:RNA polymerase sigma-70 factor (ECF subfamily)